MSTTLLRINIMVQMSLMNKALRRAAPTSTAT